MCSLASTGGVCCTWLFHIKQKHFVQQHSFLCSNIQRSTFHRRTSVPLSLQKGASFSKLNFFLAFVFLRFHTAEEVHHIPFIPSDSHSGFYFPPFAKANGFETTDCLECLQILNILYMAGRSTLKLEIGHCALY